MKPGIEWTKDWLCGLEPKLEIKASEELLEIFYGFWSWSKLEAKSKSTKQRYTAALHALGGYLVEEAGKGYRCDKSIQEFIMSYIDSGEGPLIHHENKTWQKELDAVCRKLYQYLANQC